MKTMQNAPRPMVALAVALALAPLAHAQQDTALEEVVVTAQKREQRLIDVPIAITALAGDALERRGITDVQGLEGFTPNLQISPTPGNSTAAQIAIRGSVTANPALTMEPAVGIYVDGVYVGKTQGALFDLIEIDRIEVLRGPQGTLWGRNTLSGAFNIITRKPSGEAGGSATVSVGNYSALGGKVSIDLPKIGEAKVNLAVAAQRRDGWVDNRAGNFATPPGRAASTSELNNLDSKSARLAIDVPVNDAFSIAYRGDYNDIDQNASHSQLYRALLPFLAPYVSKTRQTRATVDGPSFERSRTHGHSLTLEWQANESNTLRSITAQRKLTWEDGLDLDGSPLNIAHTQRLSDYDSLSQEFQWVGSSGKLSYRRSSSSSGPRSACASSRSTASRPRPPQHSARSTTRSTTSSRSRRVCATPTRTSRSPAARDSSASSTTCPASPGRRRTSATPRHWPCSPGSRVTRSPRI
jgi:iron complex outermembrane receptor protein